MINTGTPRSVVGHVVSGSIASSIVASAMNYNRYKKEEITKQKAICDTMKLSVQGGIATGSAIAATNHLGNGNWLGLLGAISIGAIGIYATEKISENIAQNMQEQLQIEQTQNIIEGEE